MMAIIYIRGAVYHYRMYASKLVLQSESTSYHRKCRRRVRQQKQWCKCNGPEL